MGFINGCILLYVSDPTMNFVARPFEERMDRLFKFLLLKLKEKADLQEMKEFVNSFLPVDKYRLLSRFLSERENLSQIIILRCLQVFLDERTKFLNFGRILENQEIIKCILKIIPKYCPNIKTIDFRNVFFYSESRESFKTFLKQNPGIKSLWVNCSTDNCAIYQLLFEEEFNLHDQVVKDGLLKIEIIDGVHLSPSDCARLLKLLPNLKSLGIFQTLGPLLLPAYSEDEEIANKLNKLTEICLNDATLTCLECFVKLCPNAKSISLNWPERNVLENLRQFPFLNEIRLYSTDLHIVTELYTLLKIIGKQIKSLSIIFPDEDQLDVEILEELCPEIIRLEIN